MEEILNKQAAIQIDTGEHKQGREYNAIDDYSCLRCGGNMVKLFAQHQKHIWYETCDGCDGSFFDAGEFMELSQLTVSDFFKGLSVRILVRLFDKNCSMSARFDIMYCGVLYWYTALSQSAGLALHKCYIIRSLKLLLVQD